MEWYSVNPIASIRDSYKELLLHYHHRGVGKISGITGIVITERLIKTIEKRYKQLGGDPEALYAMIPLPSENGVLN